MTWLLQRVLDLIELIVRWFDSRRYGVMARRMGRDPAGDDGRRGLIILQIDGLSHEALQQAMDRGFMPHLKRLTERDGFRLQRWWCGVPSSTPAVQGGLMYGNNWDIPAFRWYEKQSGQSVVCKNPRDARRLQDRLSRNSPGLLEGGSSYVNIFDGGARLSLFTISALGGQRFFENVRGLGFAMLLLLTPLRFGRVVGTVAVEAVRDLWQRLVGRFNTSLGLRRRPFSLAASFLQILASVVFRELQAFGVLLDIYRRVPAIYANFYGYDDVAHQLGPLDAETGRVLRGIDGRIKEIDTARRRFAARREYDLFVLSDHGMSPCTPFEALYSQTLGNLLASLVQKGSHSIVLDESSDGPWRPDTQTRLLLSELQSVQANLSPRGQRLAATLYDFVARRVPTEPDGEVDFDLRRHRDLVLRNSGTISLVYFTVAPHTLEMSEIELLYPGLLRQLLEQPGLGLILGRERGHAMVMTLRGPRRLWPPRDDLVRDLLDNLPDPDLAASQLARLISFPSSGDLVLLGRWDAQGHVVAFEPHWATHGGLGGNQNLPFMLLPPGVTWDLGAITGPEELHKLFMSRYGRQMPSPEAVSGDQTRSPFSDL